MLDAVRELGIGFVAYSPLGRGFLGGQIRSAADFGPGDIRATWPRFSGENFAKLGTVSPASLTLAPGQSQKVTAQFFMPTQPGDLGAAIRLHPSGGAQMPQIPVSLRTLTCRATVGRGGGKR